MSLLLRRLLLLCAASEPAASEPAAIARPAVTLPHGSLLALWSPGFPHHAPSCLSACIQPTAQPSPPAPLLPLPSCRSKWAAAEGHLPSADAPVKFIIDGEPMDPNDTPADLDLDGEEIIEVHFGKPT